MDTTAKVSVVRDSSGVYKVKVRTHRNEKPAEAKKENNH